eukprot:2618134-Heterocapsa_arctica.AAC.1
MVVQGSQNWWSRGKYAGVGIHEQAGGAEGSLVLHLGVLRLFKHSEDSLENHKDMRDQVICCSTAQDRCKESLPTQGPLDINGGAIWPGQGKHSENEACEQGGQTGTCECGKDGHARRTQRGTAVQELHPADKRKDCHTKGHWAGMRRKKLYHMSGKKELHRKHIHHVRPGQQSDPGHMEQHGEEAG